MYSAINVAKYIVTKCVEDECPISNLQLQKILYYVQKDFLQRPEGEPLFCDDIEAWRFGPVVPNVYYHFCGFGAMPISISYNGYSIEQEDKQRIDAIVMQKRKLNPWDMVDETHEKDGAWDQVYQGGRGNRMVITPDLIRTVG